MEFLPISPSAKHSVITVYGADGGGLGGPVVFHPGQSGGLKPPLGTSLSTQADPGLPEGNCVLPLEFPLLVPDSLLS